MFSITQAEPEFNHFGGLLPKAQPDYLSFLLRLYRVRGEQGDQPSPGGAVWRVSLENPRTRERHGFASLEEMFDFLKQEIGAAARGEVPLPDNSTATES